jgi:hypothetical protein
VNRQGRKSPAAGPLATGTNLARATEEAIMPAVIATAASAVIQAMLAYSSQNPRRRSRITWLVPLTCELATMGAFLTAQNTPMLA